MSQPDNAPYWLAWIVPAGAVLAGFWAVIQFFRKFFAMATKEELKEAFEVNQERIEERHRENQRANADLKDEVSQLKSMVSRIEGQLSGRYPNLVGKRGP